MKKKLILIISLALIVVVGVGAGAVSYAVWDGKREDLSIMVSTDMSVTVNKEKVDKQPFFRPSGALADKNSANEVTVLKFNLTLKDCSSAKFTVGDIKMMIKENEVVANAFMAVTIYKGDVINADNAVSANDLLRPGTNYIVTFKFTVDSTSELLNTDMQGSNISAMINFVGHNDGGNV